ncbi:MAG: hypothetical protein CMN31_13085 [Sandaracinus sp.]|nr:hypothetical protein [Myxococcales bacterium]MAT24363.1 hypothetical protein [Sandaracinus sp.]MBJ72251.1 hypothetical protein [Sandaracinus sp.]
MRKDSLWAAASAPATAPRRAAMALAPFAAAPSRSPTVARAPAAFRWSRGREMSVASSKSESVSTMPRAIIAGAE